MPPFLQYPEGQILTAEKIIMKKIISNNSNIDNNDDGDNINYSKVETHFENVIASKRVHFLMAAEISGACLQ